jgi:hypothetical protein
MLARVHAPEIFRVHLASWQGEAGMKYLARALYRTRATTRPSHRPRSILGGGDEVNDAAEEVGAVARAGRGLGVVLHREGRAIGERERDALAIDA